MKDKDDYSEYRYYDDNIIKNITGYFKVGQIWKYNDLYRHDEYEFYHLIQIDGTILTFIHFDQSRSFGKCLLDMGSILLDPEWILFRNIV